MYAPPSTVHSTRLGKPISVIASRTSGTFPCVFSNESTFRLSEGLRAVVTILYAAAGTFNMRRITGSSAGVPSKL